MLTDRLPTTTRTVGDLLAQAGRAGASGEVRVCGPSGVAHTVDVRGGDVVSARIAGRFDPILERLLDAGEIDEGGYLAVLEALATSDRPAGELALDLAGARRLAVHAALVAQTRERLAALLERGHARQREAWLVPDRATCPSTVALPWRDVVRGTPRARAHAPRPALRSPPASRDEARRELRRLARRLHPDLNAHLPAAEREALAAQLAVATARYHAA